MKLTPWVRITACPPRQVGGRASLEGKIARACGLLDDFPLTSLRPPSRLAGLLLLACAGAWAGSPRLPAPGSMALARMPPFLERAPRSRAAYADGRSCRLRSRPPGGRAVRPHAAIPFLELTPPPQKRACAGRSPAIRGPAHWLRANRAQVAIPCIPAGKSGFHGTIWARSTSWRARLAR